MELIDLRGSLTFRIFAGILGVIVEADRWDDHPETTEEESSISFRLISASVEY